MNCSLQSGAWRGGCQGAVDTGGLIHLSQGDLNIYAGHANDGWSWINGLTAGQTVNINGQKYQVAGESIEGAKDAPGSGTWMQTCNGNGNHLVGIRPVGRLRGVVAGRGPGMAPPGRVALRPPLCGPFARVGGGGVRLGSVVS